MMTDPATAIQREVHDLISSQIETLRRPSFLSDSELTEYRGRAERIENLFSVLDRIEGEKVPKWRARLRARDRRWFAGRD